MTSRVIVSIRIDAAPDVVFDAFTQDIALWWRHEDFFRFTPRSPGVLSFEPPDADGQNGRLVETLPRGQVFEIGQVHIWERGVRLLIGWRQATFGPDQETEVEVRFEPAAGGTRVTVEHRGWDAIPQPHVARHGLPLARFLERQGRQWRAGLATLQDRVSPPSVQHD
jgi:uncharacterized protein YndB with AHSA1/START domain